MTAVDGWILCGKFNYLIYYYMQKIKLSKITVMLWFFTILFTLSALASKRQYERCQKENFSLSLDACGIFDRKHYIHDDTAYGAASYERIGISFVNDTVVHRIRNAIKAHHGDSIYIVDGIAVTNYPCDLQTLRDAVSPNYKSVQNSQNICLIMFILATLFTISNVLEILKKPY